MKTRFLAIFYLLITLNFLNGCAQIEGMTGNLFLMSEEKESTLGVELASEIEKEYPIYKSDPAASRYVENLGQRLVAASPIQSGQQFHFQIVDSEDVNAFAIPGGWCYVNLGLLRQAESEAELASVVAHEIGHVTARHSAKGISRSQVYSTLGGLLVSGDSGALTQLAVNLTQSGVLLRHSRQDEFQADQLAVDTMINAQIDPNGLVTFFNKIDTIKQGASPRLASYFSTHPPTSERIAQAKNRIATKSKGKIKSGDSSNFKEIKKRYPPK